jgi:soluble lytic murein transglycosylase-like protein
MGKLCLLLALVINSVVFTNGQVQQNAINDMSVKSGVNVAVKEIHKTADSNEIKAAKTQINEVFHSLPIPSPLEMLKNNALGTLSTGDAAVDGYILASCTRYKIDPLLIYAQMTQESGFKLKATSYKGASGLMQLMPDTAIRFGVKNIYDPKQNIEAGVKYMRWLLDKFEGDVSLALAGYNAGEGAVIKYGYQIPPFRETQNYVARITAHYDEIKNLNSDSTNSNINSVELAKVF